MNCEIYEHNRNAYANVKEAFKKTNRTCIVQPTGTGKTYIALQLIDEYKGGNKFLYITSYTTTLNDFIADVEDKIGSVDIDYSIYRNAKKIMDNKYDFIILDEFHRSGAKKWQLFISLIIDNNPDAKILGMSATPIRYLDEERNMADEIFKGSVANNMTMSDAIICGILKPPEYTCAVYSLQDEIKNVESKIKKCYEVRDDTLTLLNKAKRMIQNSSGLEELFKKNIKNKKGKYIVFCSTHKHMNKMVEECEKWFSFIENKRFYKISAKERDAYYEFVSDDSDCLKLLFTVNMLNEGVHVSGIDGVILFRPTDSMNVYLQQIGRAMSASSIKPPQIIDVVNNAISLSTARSYWHRTSLDIKERSESHKNNIKEIQFNIFDEQVEILSILDKINQTIEGSFEEWYEIAKKCYEEKGDIYLLKNEYYEGKKLGSWINKQKIKKSQFSLDEEKINMLNNINIDWSIENDMHYEKYYKKAEKLRFCFTGGCQLKYDDRELYSWLRRQVRLKNMPQKWIRKFYEVGLNIKDEWYMKNIVLNTYHDTIPIKRKKKFNYSDMTGIGEVRTGMTWRDYRHVNND